MWLNCIPVFGMTPTIYFIQAKLTILRFSG